MSMIDVVDIVDGVKNYLENIEMHEITKEQKKWIKDQFNTYINFEYGLTKDNNFVLKMSSSNFRSAEYYMGLEYERNSIILQIEFKNEIIVIYDGDNTRVRSIFEYLRITDINMKFA